MYVPEKFRETRVPVMLAAIADMRLGCLVFANAAGFCATHVPVLVGNDGGAVTLRAHVARANDAWARAGAGVDAVAIFQGPHAYVHPGWYPSKAEAGRVVPTWAYITVHAHGRLRAVDDAGFVRNVVNDLTSAMEAGRPDPWASADAPPAYIDGLIKSLVGLKFRVTKLESAWKLNQNKTPADRNGVAAALVGQSPPHPVGLAMTEILQRHDPGSPD